MPIITPARRYSFRDIVELTVARKLRDNIGVSLQALRTIQKILSRDYQAPFAQAWHITDGHDFFELREKQADITSVLRQPGQSKSCLPFAVLDMAVPSRNLSLSLQQARYDDTGNTREDCPG